jgi:hypothetical protein
MDNGINTGQITSAIIRKMYVAAFWSKSCPPELRVTHSVPSANCCKPKKSGIPAKSLYAGLLAVLTVATPTVDTTTAPAKLAPAEKHMDAF